MTKRLFFAFLAILALLLSGCADKKPTSPAAVKGRLAVAGFSHPLFTWELLAGYLPENNPPIDRKVLAELDQALNKTLYDHGVEGFTPARVTRQCQEIVVFENQKRQAALTYWEKVGRCVPSDYILVPQVIEYRNRIGKDWGASQTAKVVMDFFLIEVKTGRLAARSRFDEAQQPLSDNMLHAGKFFKRGGKFIPAIDLAKEGMDEAMTELGL